ncbi:MAG: NAD(P)H-dependent oxidoreductase [Bacteroidota bacterium]
MITVISGTNRPNSRTLHFARHFRDELAVLSKDKVALLDLAEIDHAFFRPAMYDSASMPAGLRRLQEQQIIGAEKIAIVCPEYNGGYPGALKTFIDAISVYRYKENFLAKPVSLIGVSTGRAGNLRGLDQLAQIIQHMGGYLMTKKLPLSRVDDLLDDSGKVIDENTLASLREQANQLVGIHT